MVYRQGDFWDDKGGAHYGIAERYFGRICLASSGGFYLDAAELRAIADKLDELNAANTTN